MEVDTKMIVIFYLAPCVALFDYYNLPFPTLTHVIVNKLPYFDLIFNQHLNPSTIIQPYPEGWIVLYPNATPGEKGIPARDFIADQIIVKYLGRYGEVAIWHWYQKR